MNTAARSIRLVRMVHCDFTAQRTAIQAREFQQQAQQCSLRSKRYLHASSIQQQAPKERRRKIEDRPRSDETTQTDFNELNVLGNIPPPASSIESCEPTGFVLSNGVQVQDAGIMLVGGEVFRWSPWNRQGSTKAPETMSRLGGQMHVGKESWGVLDLIWPKPDLLVVGTGRSIKALSPETRKIISSFGIRVEVLDTRNAASQYNLLATERGVHEIAAAIIPIGVD